MTKIFACSLTAGNPSSQLSELFLLLRKEQIMTEDEIPEKEYQCFRAGDGQSICRSTHTQTHNPTHTGRTLLLYNQGQEGFFHANIFLFKTNTHTTRSNIKPRVRGPHTLTQCDKILRHCCQGRHDSCFLQDFHHHIRVMVVEHHLSAVKRASFVHFTFNYHHVGLA